jgi:hypothetical protein
VAARKHPALAAIRRDPGWRCLVLLSAMFGVRPKLVVLHFIDNDLRREGIADFSTWAGGPSSAGRCDEAWSEPGRVS